MDKFNERLKQAMIIKKVSQSELCKRTGIPKSAMSQYVSGAFSPKQERTYLIAKALNVNESWLLGYDDVNMEKENAPGEYTGSDAEMISIKATEKQWTEILNKLSQENLDRLQEQAELLLLKQQVQDDTKEK